MQSTISDRHPLRRLFAAVTEQTFQVHLGVADPRLTSYLAELLLRFVHIDTVYRLGSVRGRRLEEVAEMLAEAEAQAGGDSRREIYRHIGDFALFWTGVYPEALPILREQTRKDHLIDYFEQGKRSYYIASTFDAEQYREEAPVLRRLSEEFELCAFGLGQVRQSWERLEEGGAREVRQQLLS